MVCPWKKRKVITTEYTNIMVKETTQSTEREMFEPCDGEECSFYHPSIKNLCCTRANFVLTHFIKDEMV